MPESIVERFDRFGRNHPGLTFAFTVASALVTAAILLVYSLDQTILYKAF